MRTEKTWIGVTVLALASAGCASGVGDGFDQVTAVASERLGQEVEWRRTPEEDEAVREQVEDLLTGPLSMDDAVRVALINSPRLQAEFERLGVARADWVQARLIENPVLGATWQGVSGGRGETLEVGLVQSLMSLPLRPARKRLASLELEQTRLELADTILLTAIETRQAYVDLAAAQATVVALADIVAAAEAGAELASRQRQAGNINALEFAERRAFAAETGAALVHAEQEAIAARERVGLLLGVEGTAAWSITATVTSPPAAADEVEGITQLALERRLDLAAARLEVQALAEALDVTVRWRWFLVADVGVEYEEEVDGVDLFGPTLSIQLPIFDRGQARIARLEALERASHRRLTQLALAVRSEVREAHARLGSQRELVEQYREVLLPARREIVTEAQKHYNYMLVGTFRLLGARRDEIAAEIAYREAVRDAWRAWIDLERAVGWPLPVGGEVEAAEPEVEEQEMEKEMEHEHHH